MRRDGAEYAHFLIFVNNYFAGTEGDSADRFEMARETSFSTQPILAPFGHRRSDGSAKMDQADLPVGQT
jgi:hypothetical protein